MLWVEKRFICGRLIRINMNSSSRKYYIFTPADTCTGGPEALHQLAYYMRKLGMNAFTVYYTYSNFPDAEPIDRYRQYKVNVVRYDEIEDESSNFVFAPENAPWCLNGFKKAQKCIWWLSLHANEVKEPTLKERINVLKKRLFNKDLSHYRHLAFDPNDCWHLCASKHTYLYVDEHYKKSRREYMVEPISMDFLKMGNVNLHSKREDVVLYNPSKPSALMTELLDRSRFNYVPLIGYTPEGLAERYKKAKLYVDFGLFGGPERMPKEAVYFGCNILVANHNAAANDFDVAIPSKYKVSDGETASQVESRIADMLLNYDIQNFDFMPFKVKVERLEENFLIQLSDIFIDR